MKTVLLIDGDQFVFKATAALERDTRWDDTNHVLYSNADECWTNLQSMLKRIFERFRSDEHALTFTTAPNFRRDVDPTYKMGRSTRKPLCYAEIRERCEGTYNCLAMPGLEADDVMGILATKPNGQHKIIVSQDKDMRSIPGTVWNGKDLIKVSENDADYFHLMQTLTGDTSDGYKGCPGIGAVKAAKILDEAKAAATFNGDLPASKHKLMRYAWIHIVEAFKEKNLTEEHALTQARLARILRWTDWDVENKKPILWSPPSTRTPQKSPSSADDQTDAPTPSA